MRTTRLWIAIAVALAGLMPTAASARHSRARRHGHIVATAPTADAVELGQIAPPTRRTTLEQTYGDAAIARSQFQRRYSREEQIDRREAATVGTPYPCDPRSAGADAYDCGNDPRQIGYGQYYAYTPSFVSSPTVVGAEADTQTTLLPPFTALFWGLNSLENHPHD